MSLFDRLACGTKKGFTLIELLIVIAIILILIAIALPNFLEAQVRAKVTATRGNLKSFETAMNSFVLANGDVYPDYNDYGGNLVLLYARLRAHVNTQTGCTSPERVCSCTQPPLATYRGITFLDGIQPGEYYSRGIHCPLTSPIKYMSDGSTADPFGDGFLPHGYDAFPEIRNNISTGHYSYGAIFGVGPDRVAGDWLRGTKYTIDVDGDGIQEALPYNPTNGTNSRGDFWRIIATDVQTAKSHYGGRLTN